ncbi:hypothetical protein HPB50_027901 [Hyalomma asiaticum]|nr:hypothetical protein HPB50_027901 [Hyalomma asiaticum]
MSGLEKLLKTGIAAASESSNVLHNERPELRKGILVNAPVTSGSSVKLPPEAGLVLERLKIARVPASLPTLQLSATVYVGGYIARVIREHVTCDSCYSLMSKPLSYQPLQQLTRNQDRGGLLYPSDQLVYVLDILRLFVESALKKAPKLEKPLRTLQEAAIDVDKAYDVGMKYSITAVPTFIILLNGQPVDRVEGKNLVGTGAQAEGVGSSWGDATTCGS